MTDTELLAYAKVSLRVASTAYDTEIENLISAGKTDITQACERGFDADDSVMCDAVVLYVKANFSQTLDDKAYSRYQQRLACIGLRKSDTYEG